MSEKFIKLASCGCRSWFCDRCCMAKGGALRQRLQWVVDSCFTSLLFLTLTINPKQFASPWEAYTLGSRRISKCVRRLEAHGALHSDKWFRVLECHKNGWPHFHVLLDAAFVPFQLVWRAWNGTPRTSTTQRNPEWGIVDVRGGDRFESREHAVNYITAYVMKRPGAGWPEWILDRTERIRRYASSKRFWGELTAAHPRATEFNVADLERVPVQRRRLPTGLSHKQRIASCGGKTVAREVVEVVGRDGEIRERGKFIGMLGDSVDVWAEQLQLQIEEGKRSVVLPFEQQTADFLKANCVSQALRKLRLDEQASKFRKAERARASPRVQQSLFNGCNGSQSISKEQ